MGNPTRLRSDTDLSRDADMGCALMVAVWMREEAYRQNKMMMWDAGKEVAVTV